MVFSILRLMLNFNISAQERLHLYLEYYIIEYINKYSGICVFQATLTTLSKKKQVLYLDNIIFILRDFIELRII